MLTFMYQLCHSCINLVETIPLLPYLPSAAATATRSVVSGDGVGYDCPVDGCYGDGNDNSLMWSYANPCLL